MKDITFINLYNYWYIVIPIVACIMLLLGFRKKVRIAAFFKIHYGLTERIIGIALITLGLVLVVVALLGPSKSLGDTEIKTNGLDIYVLLDTSKSMLSEDVAPSRLARSKAIVEAVLAGLNGDRVGFIPFASSAYIQMPLTDDYDLAEMFLQVVDTDMISGGGSNVAKALEVAMGSFEAGAKGDKVIMILSDGEEHDDETQTIITDLKNSGVKIISVGIGTAAGGLIPELGQDGKQIVGYMKDSEGNTVLTKLNESLLNALARDTGGVYYSEVSTPDVADKILQTLDTYETSVRGVKKIKNYEQLFQYFLGAGLLLFLMGWIIIGRGGIHEKVADTTGNY